MNEEIKFSLSSDVELSLVTSAGVFTPNTTTNLLIDAVKGAISKRSSVLDLGCGTGVVGIALHLQDLVKECGIIGVAAGSIFVFKGKYKAVLINYPNKQQKVKNAKFLKYKNELNP